MSYKLDKIKSICDLWSGGFKNGDSAMYEISNIINMKTVKVENLRAMDENGNIVMEFSGECEINFKK